MTLERDIKEKVLPPFHLTLSFDLVSLHQRFSGKQFGNEPKPKQNVKMKETEKMEFTSRVLVAMEKFISNSFLFSIVKILAKKLSKFHSIFFCE